MKRLQNRISESRLALPVTAVYGTAIWAAGGLFTQQWWIQFALFALSTYLMVELNNSNALIRIYSRMVSCSFIVLSTMACFTFSSLYGACIQLCFIGALTFLFKSYQNKEATGCLYMTALCLGLSSLCDIHSLLFIPLLWFVMYAFMQCFSVKTWTATCLGFLTPYWFALPSLLYGERLGWFTAHFASLSQFDRIGDYSTLGPQQWLTLAFVCTAAAIGIVHYLHTSFNDKIRIRLIFECFICTDIYALGLLLLQPQHYELSMNVLIINTSPLIAHFIALTQTRTTNIAFIVMTVLAMALTACNLWGERLELPFI